MKVKELIERLQQADPEEIVILQADSEGNGYSPLSLVDTHCYYQPHDMHKSHRGRVYNSKDDAGIWSVPCVCLVPKV